MRRRKQRRNRIGTAVGKGYRKLALDACRSRDPEWSPLAVDEGLKRQHEWWHAKPSHWFDGLPDERWSPTKAWRAALISDVAMLAVARDETWTETYAWINERMHVWKAEQSAKSLTLKL